MNDKKNNCLKKILYVLKTTGRKREKEKVKEMENKETGLRWSNKKKWKRYYYTLKRNSKFILLKNGTKCTEAELKEIII